MQLTLFDEVVQGTHEFMVTKLKPNGRPLLNEDRTIRYYHKEFTLDEMQEIIERAVKTEKSRYGYDIYTVNGHEYISIYIRFGNITPKAKDSARTFINKNWEYH